MVKQLLSHKLKNLYFKSHSSFASHIYISAKSFLKGQMKYLNFESDK